MSGAAVIRGAPMTVESLLSRRDLDGLTLEFSRCTVTLPCSYG
jgi:uncharacterized protein (DUF433 family)